MHIGVKNITSGKTKKGTDYYIFDGYIDGKVNKCKIWNVSTPLSDGCIILANSVKEGEYKGNKEYVIDDYSIVDEYDKKNELFGIKEVSGHDFFDKIWEIVFRNIDDEDYGELLNKFFKGYKEDFCLATGAKGVHHAYSGGLAEHTLDVVATCEAFLNIYRDKIKNKSLLMTAAFLHDIGKIITYEKKDDVLYDYSEVGIFCDHLFLGCKLIDPYLKKLPEKKAMLLEHCILSHHGKRDWGSPVTPSILEAQLLHYADNISAKVATIETMINEHNDKNGMFTKGSVYLDGSRMYVGEY